MDQIIKNQILNNSYGYNFKKQIETVIPEFFEGSYVALKMKPKMKDKQHQHYPHVVALEPCVIASTNPEYLEGDIIEVDENVNGLMRILGQGSNLTVSPNQNERPYIQASNELLEEGPYVSLEIYLIDPAFKDFEDYRIIYSYSSRIADLTPGNFSVGLCKYNMHFAFLPMKGNEHRKNCFIDHGWELKF